MSHIQSPLLLSPAFVTAFAPDPMVGGHLYVPLASQNTGDGSWNVAPAALTHDTAKAFLEGMEQVRREAHALYGENFPLSYLKNPSTRENTDCAVRYVPIRSEVNGHYYEFRHMPSLTSARFILDPKHPEEWRVEASHDSLISPGTSVQMVSGIVRRRDQSFALSRTFYLIQFFNTLEADNISELRQLLAIDDHETSDFELGRQIASAADATVSDEPSPPQPDGFWLTTVVRGAYDAGHINIVIARPAVEALRGMMAEHAVLEVFPDAVGSPLPKKLRPVWKKAEQLAETDRTKAAVHFAGQMMTPPGGDPGEAN